MPCPHIQDVSALIDDELSPEEAAQVRSHLEVCSECRSELASLRQLSGLFAQFREAEEETTFVDRRETGWSRFLAAAAVVMIAVGGIVGLATELREDELRFETYLERSVDADVYEVSSLREDDLSRDRIVGLLISSAH